MMHVTECCTYLPGCRCPQSLCQGRVEFRQIHSVGLCTGGGDSVLCVG